MKKPRMIVQIRHSPPRDFCNIADNSCLEKFLLWLDYWLSRFKSEKCLIILDDGKEITVIKSKVLKYQEEHPEAVIKSISPTQ
jgi:hypothetical protein